MCGSVKFLAMCRRQPWRYCGRRQIFLVASGNEMIKVNDDLTKEHHQFFVYQMHHALKYIHTGMHIHENLYFCMKGLASSVHFICVLCS
jgi:hypothetical protein